MYWNYRVVKEDALIEIKEVYYEKDDKPHGEAQASPSVWASEGVEALRDVLQMMMAALDKPVLEFVPDSGKAGGSFKEIELEIQREPVEEGMDAQGVGVPMRAAVGTDRPHGE